MFVGPYFDYFHITYYGVTILLIEITAIIHILLNKRNEPQTAILWIVTVLYLPLFGLLLYLVFGINKISSSELQIRIADQLIRTKKHDPMHKALGGHQREQVKHVFSGGDRSSYPIFQSALDRLLPGTMPLDGNSLELLNDGTKAYPRMLEEISKAKSSVHLQSFIIMDDAVGREILGALERKAREGLDVKVLYDRFGSMKAGFMFRRYGKNVKNFSIMPFSCRNRFIMPWAVQLRNHRKLLVIDGETAFIGGINISSNNDIRWSRKDEYIHDLHCLVKGPAVGELQFSFVRDWFYVSSQNVFEILKKEYFPPLARHGNSIVRVVSSGPGQDYEATEKVFMCAVMTAKSHVWIMTPYFVPEKSFWKLLCASISRGIEVRIIVPKKNNHWYVQYASQSLFPGLLESGVRIYEKEGSFSHAKAMIVDGEWAFMGSSNCDVRSFKLNFELDFVVQGGDFMNELHKQFIYEFSASTELKLADVENKGLLRQLAEISCSLFTPVM